MGGLCGRAGGHQRAAGDAGLQLLRQTTCAFGSLRCAARSVAFADAALQRLAFAHGKSDVVAKADGSWLPPDKRAKAVHGAGAYACARVVAECAHPRRSPAPLTARPPRGTRAPSEDQDDEGAAADRGAAAAAAAAAAGQPNKILFVEGLPEATTSSMLAMLFQQFPGYAPARPAVASAAHHAARRYAEVRMVEAKPGIAFVEFQTELQAGVALTGLAGFKITPTHSMNITYARL